MCCLLSIILYRLHVIGLDILNFESTAGLGRQNYNLFATAPLSLKIQPDK